MSINARCGSCNRELLLGQLVQPSNGFRCPVCGFTFAPAYATVAPGVAARLGVVPGALYNHVRNKQQLQDLVLDGVLAEVDFHTNPSLAWTEQLTILATRLRQVLEAHPGVAGILKTRDPLGPHSLALAEAFLSPLQTAGFADR